MTNVDNLIDKIVEETGTDPGEIRIRMDKKKEIMHGLLSDYGAIYAVAKELGVDLNREELILTKISGIEPQKSFNVVGRAGEIYLPKEFSRKDGTIGKVASIVLCDDTGNVRLTLWDTNVEVANMANKNDILLVKNAYGKEGMRGIELNAGSLTNISINPKKMGSDLPEIKENLIKIKDLSPDMFSVSVICRINMYYSPTEFQRSDGSTGTRASFIAGDETGTIKVVLWDNSAKTELARGDIVKIENAYTKEGMNGDLELQAGNRSRLVKSDKKLKLPDLPEIKDLYKIDEVTKELKGFDVIARVVQIFETREYGEEGGKLTRLLIGDETGTISVVAWNEKSDSVNDLKSGDAIRIKNAYARENLQGNPEIQIGKYSDITTTDEKVATLEKIQKARVTEKSIGDLKDGDADVKITGKLIDIEEDRRITFMTCPKCRKKVQNIGGEWFCEACGDIEPVENLIVSATVEDKTGSMKIVVFRENAEKILGMDVGEVMNIIGETQDEYAPVRQAKDNIIGKSVSLTGRVRFSDFSEQIEFMVSNVE